MLSGKSIRVVLLVLLMLLLPMMALVAIKDTVAAMVSEGSIGPQAVAQQDLFDFGDALDPPYPTLLQSGGAHHNIAVTQLTLYLGDGVDAEPDGQPDAEALGDDNNGDDEDGVTFPEPLVQCQQGQAKVIVYRSGGPSAYLNAWIDFNRDGDWADVGEQVAWDRTVGTGTHLVYFMVPCDAVPGLSFGTPNVSVDAGGPRNQARYGQSPDLDRCGLWMCVEPA